MASSCVISLISSSDGQGRPLGRTGFGLFVGFIRLGGLELWERRLKPYGSG